MDGRKLEESLCVSFTQKAKDPVVTGCEGVLYVKTNMRELPLKRPMQNEMQASLQPKCRGARSLLLFLGTARGRLLFGKINQ